MVMGVPGGREGERKSKRERERERERGCDSHRFRGHFL